MHFSPVDPTQALPDELVPYMKIPTFLMLMEGKVFIPSLKTLQRTDPTEARLAGRSGPGFYKFHNALTQDEAFKWLYSKAQKYDRDFLDARIQQRAVRLDFKCLDSKRKRIPRIALRVGSRIHRFLIRTVKFLGKSQNLHLSASQILLAILIALGMRKLRRALRN